MSKQNKTGLASVYVAWAHGYHGRLRPSYDSVANHYGELTLEQVNTLEGMIRRYLGKCRKANVEKLAAQEQTP